MKVKYSRFRNNAKQTSFTSPTGPRRQGGEHEHAQYPTNDDVTSGWSCRRSENVSILSSLLLLWGGRGVIWQFFSEVQHVYYDKFVLAARHTMIIQITIKLKGNTNNVWIKMLTWQNEQGSHHSLEVFMQFKHLQLQYEWNTAKIRLHAALINAPYWSNLSIVGVVTNHNDLQDKRANVKTTN